MKIKRTLFSALLFSLFMSVPVLGSEISTSELCWTYRSRPYYYSTYYNYYPYRPNARHYDYYPFRPYYYHYGW